MGCHTAQGGRPYAGGHRLATSIGTFITPNITPDQETGIGLWNEEDFWRALHEGKARNGSPLYPAFPYTEYTKVTREDSNAIFAYLQSLPPVQQRNPPSRIRFPFNLRPLIYVWRALYFEQGVYQPETAKSDEWNRGAYLVQGLGHCNACHTTRNPFGASQGESIGRRTNHGLQLVCALSDLPPGGQHLRLADRGYRSIAHDRFVIPRSHNRADGGCRQPKSSVSDEGGRPRHGCLPEIAAWERSPLQRE